MIQWSIEHTEPKVIFYDDPYKEMLKSLNLSESILTVQTSYFHDLDSDFETDLQTCSSAYPDVNISGEDPVGITFTSGTTGKPKGVVFTHNNLYAAGICNGFMTEIRQTGLRMLYATPLFHASGTSVLGYQVLSGATYIFLPQLDPHLMLDTMEKEKVQSTFLPPALLNLMLPMIYQKEEVLSSLQEISTGGSILSPSVVRDYATLGYNVVQGYGLTENSGTVTFWDTRMGYHTCDSVGKPFLNEIKVLHPHTREEVPVGQIGELAVRGPMVFKEYWRNPEATEKAFHNGWLLTGDAVRVDEEGFVYLIDRYKDVIFFSGLDAIYPSEVEKVLEKMDEIVDVSVVGVRHDRWGELSCAFVVRKSERVTREQILQFAHTRMEKHKLADVLFVDELPRNPLGKVEKPKLRELYHPQSSTL